MGRSFVGDPSPGRTRERGVRCRPLAAGGRRRAPAGRARRWTSAARSGSAGVTAAAEPPWRRRRCLPGRGSGDPAGRTCARRRPRSGSRRPGSPTRSRGAPRVKRSRRRPDEAEDGAVEGGESSSVERVRGSGEEREDQAHEDPEPHARRAGRRERPGPREAGRDPLHLLEVGADDEAVLTGNWLSDSVSTAFCASTYFSKTPSDMGYSRDSVANPWRPPGPFGCRLGGPQYGTSSLQPKGPGDARDSRHLSLEYPMSLGVFEQYVDAQKAVDTLSDDQFPVENCLIVGTDLKQMERVTARLTWGRVALGGLSLRRVARALRGPDPLALLPPLEPVDPAALHRPLRRRVRPHLVGVGYAFTRGARDFSSVSQVVATRYEVFCEHQFASRVARSSPTRASTSASGGASASARSLPTSPAEAARQARFGRGSAASRRPRAGLQTNRARPGASFPVTDPRRRSARSVPKAPPVFRRPRPQVSRRRRACRFFFFFFFFLAG